MFWQISTWTYNKNKTFHTVDSEICPSLIFLKVYIYIYFLCKFLYQCLCMIKRNICCMLYSIYWPSFIFWLPSLVEIFGNICIVIICCPACDVINCKINRLKLVSAIFIKNFIFHQMIVLQKLWKMFLISSEKLFSFSRYSNFCISIFPCFSPSQPLF